uniref:Uncharacterized protein n=1 Tax=Arundo donax TaxID=35708 RepID=A0A0A8XUM5_ARUDO
MDLHGLVLQNSTNSDLSKWETGIRAKNSSEFTQFRCSPA